MIKEEVTQNIYARWYRLLQNKARGATLKPIRSLEAFSLDELYELKWLIEERLKSMEGSHVQSK